jgi:septal ring factor EnvC (AmiA/AmiB activator)
MQRCGPAVTRPCGAQLLQDQRRRDDELLRLQLKCKCLEDASAASCARLQAVSGEAEVARSGLKEQQQQLLAAVDLQGRTHSRLMQLTAEHDQVCHVTSARRFGARDVCLVQLTADHARVSQALRALAQAAAAADEEAAARDRAHAIDAQLLKVAGACLRAALRCCA